MGLRVFLFQICLSAISCLGAQQVALTFDDLPSHGPLPTGVGRADVAKSIIAALRQAKAPPVYGFVIGKTVHDNPHEADVLALWKAAGFRLGNHTWSHLDLHTSTTGAFENEVTLDEPVLRQFMSSGGWRWFRYPFLHEGKTPQESRAVRAYLTRRGYRIAEVSLSFDDYAWNEPYARCTARNDSAGIEELKRTYLKAADETLQLGPEMARLILGRDMKHILLLHFGAFQMVMLPRLLELLKARRFALITLEDAATDSAYDTKPVQAANWHGTRLELMMLAKGLPPPSIAPLRRLGDLCR